MEEVKKTWSNVVSRRGLILRSLARTNVIKRDADEWLARMDNSILDNEKESFREESLEGSRLISKYNDIVNQYNMKARH